MFFRFTILLCLIIVTFSFAQIDITVRWNRPRGEITPKLFGVNVWGGYDPDKSTHPVYQDNMTLMSPGLIRFHSSESTRDSNEHSRGWVNYDTQSWDSGKIDEVLGAFGDHVQNAMMTISNWPIWFDEDGNGRLDADQFDAYAEWCAELVRVINVELDYGITFWTTFNEAENKVQGNAAGLADLFNRCAEAMKAVDPSIKVGGGEWTQPWDDSGLDTFISLAKDHMDFFCYHHYVTGDSEKPDAEIFSAASGIASRAGAIRNKLKSAGIGDIPLYLSEYNVFWSWQYDQSRGFQRSIQGAIYNALLLKYSAEGGVLDGTLLWNDCDGIYGIMDSSFEPRPSMYVMMLKNRFLCGTPVSSSSRKSSVVNAFAVDAPIGKAVMLINQSEEEQAVHLMFDAWAPSASSAERHIITEMGYDTHTLTLEEGWNTDLTVDPLSITLIKFEQETSVDHKSDILPNTLQLRAAYPNPFNSQTTVEFTLVVPQYVELSVYDIRGNLLEIVAQKFYSAGQQTMTWNADNVASGIYVLELLTPGQTLYLTITLIK